MSAFLPVFKPWKARTCADCGKRHPTHNRDGGKGPWRCRPCHDKADPMPAPIAALTDPAQGSLL